MANYNGYIGRTKRLFPSFLKYAGVILITILFCHHYYSNRQVTVTYSASRNASNTFPRHWKSLLQYPSTLKLVFIDEPSLNCLIGTVPIEAEQGCQQLYSAHTTRVGTYLSIEEFQKLFYEKIVKGQDGGKKTDKWSTNATIPEQNPDTTIIQYWYHENFEKSIIVSTLKKNDNLNYYKLRGARQLQSHAIRHFDDSKISLASLLDDGQCENDCNAFVPMQIKRHMAYLKAGSLMECNRETALKIPKDATWRLPNVTVPITTHLLDQYIEAGQIPFMCHGTILGWYRDCNIIPHTHDFDFCIHAHQFIPDFHKQFAKDPLHPVWRSIGRREYGFELTFYLNHGIKDHEQAKLDIFYVYEHNSTHLWTPLLMNFQKGTRVQDFLPIVDKLCTADLRGQLFLAPCNVREYLNVRYGSTWEVLNKNAGYFEKGVEYVYDGNWETDISEVLEYF
uniref:Fukutin n=1 Tax=Panagrellus redivivus TaxID=6233 RepID=A0A7E4ZTE3_PANRE